MATANKAALPALEDLHNKARKSNPIYPCHYLPLDTRLHQNQQGQHYPAGVQPNVMMSIPVAAQEQDVQCSSHFLKHCTTVLKCSRLKSGLPNYRPLHRQLSSSQSPTTRFLANWREWTTFRQACVLTAFICIIAVVLCVIVSALMSSPIIASRPAKGRQWYQDSTFYEIFPASFQDTDSDGYGDFQGIIQRLDYIRDLGVTGLRLSSIFCALDYPLEFEHIIDLRNVDPHLGRLGDFRRLVREAHARGLQVVLDLNPTVTSDQHTWALHWQRGIPGYEHFYASANRSKEPPEMENTEGPPPEDWELTQRTFGGHYTLNWSNPSVQREYQKMLNHWLNFGVDGFYMKHMDKMHVLDPEDIRTVVRQWRIVLDRPPAPWEGSMRRVLIVSGKFARVISGTLKNPGRVLDKVDLLDYPVLIGTGQEMAEEISGLKTARWNRRPMPMWHLGSSDTFRVASRIEPTYRMAAFYFLMMLPGSTSVFYGDEIGLRDSYDVFSGRIFRGGQLTPMQWTADNSTGGFTDNMTSPWLPLNPDHFTTNAENQRPLISEFQRLVQLQSTLRMSYRQNGHSLEVLEPNVIVLERLHKKDRSQRIVLCANFGKQEQIKEFPKKYSRIEVLSVTEGNLNDVATKRGFRLSPGQAFVAKVYHETNIIGY